MSGTAEDELIALAIRECGGLLPAERALLSDLFSGDHSSARVADAAASTQMAADQFSTYIRARVIQWLCTSQAAVSNIGRNGVVVAGVNITGTLDLSDATISFPVALLGCQIPEGMLLARAKMTTLILTGSICGRSLPYGAGASVAAVYAAGLKTESNVHLADGFVSYGTVVLAEAEIGGQFSCRNATMLNPTGISILADGLSVGSDLLLDGGFHSDGTVSLRDVQVGGKLIVAGSLSGQRPAYEHGQIDSARMYALNADRISTGSHIFLDGQFDGEVSLMGASVGGQLVCRCSCSNPLGTALAADGMHVRDAMFFTTTFSAIGTVHFQGASIGGSLLCDGMFASATNPLDTVGGPREFVALRSEQSSIGAFTQIRGRFIGAVSFSGTTFAGEVLCQGAIILNPNGSALVLTSAELRSDLIISSTVEAVGTSRITAAHIGGRLACSGLLVKPSSTFHVGSAEEAETRALSAEQLRVERDCVFDGRVLGGIWAPGWNVGGSLAFIRATVDGPVTLVHSRIEDRFVWRDLLVGPNTELDVSYASAAILDDDLESWPAAGRLKLDGFEYVRLIEQSMTSGCSWWQRLGARFDRSTNRSTRAKQRSAVEKRIEWIRKQDIYRPQPYQQLASVLKAMGLNDQARDVLIAGQDDLRTLGGLRGWLWLRNWLAGWTLAHGYQVWRPLLAGALTIAVGAIVFWLGREQLNETGDLVDPSGTRTTLFSAFWFSLDAFLPIVDYVPKVL